VARHGSVPVFILEFRPSTVNMERWDYENVRYRSKKSSVAKASLEEGSLHLRKRST
jgi:hypothetical protein